MMMLMLMEGEELSISSSIEASIHAREEKKLRLRFPNDLVS